jgi:hypothetical protein
MGYGIGRGLFYAVSGLIAGRNQCPNAMPSFRRRTSQIPIRMKEHSDGATVDNVTMICQSDRKLADT